MMFDLTRWPIRGPISMSEDNWRELRQEVERLREVERKALEQSEYIQKHGLTEWDMALKNAEVDRLRTVLKAVEWLTDYDGVRWCPSCSCLWPEHASGCQLKAALDAAGGGK